MSANAEDARTRARTPSPLTFLHGRRRCNMVMWRRCAGGRTRRDRASTEGLREEGEDLLQWWTQNARTLPRGEHGYHGRLGRDPPAGSREGGALPAAWGSGAPSPRRWGAAGSSSRFVGGGRFVLFASVGSSSTAAMPSAMGGDGSNTGSARRGAACGGGGGERAGEQRVEEEGSSTGSRQGRRR